jgi:flagellar hook-associated protein 2
VGTGTLTLGLGGKTFTVNLDDTHSSLNAIRDAINSATDNPGVSATIVNGTNTAQLVLTSALTGAANTITVATNGGNGGLSSLTYDAAHTGNYASLEGANDASIKVAGVTVTSASNTVTSAIDGVTLNLLTTTAVDTPVSLTIANDTNTVVNRVQNFVSSYNTLQSVVAKLGNYDAASQTGGPLLGDALLDGISSQLRRTLSNPVSSVSSGQFNTLASLGITTNQDGSLTLDATKLNSALSNNFNAVSAVFGASDGVATGLSKFVDAQLASGSGIDTRNKTLATRQKQITDEQATISARQAQVTARYTAQFTAMDTALAQMQQTSSYLTQQFNNLAKQTTSLFGG